MSEDKVDELEEELSKMWSALNQEVNQRQAVLEDAYSEYGMSAFEGKSDSVMSKAKERCLYLRGVAEGWEGASSLLNSLIREFIESKVKETQKKK